MTCRWCDCNGRRSVCTPCHTLKDTALSVLLQCARLALDQYKALFPERCSAEDVAAISAALERQLRQRQRQREQWQMQRKHEKRILEVS